MYVGDGQESDAGQDQLWVQHQLAGWEVAHHCLQQHTHTPLLNTIHERPQLRQCLGRGDAWQTGPTVITRLWQMNRMLHLLGL